MAISVRGPDQWTPTRPNFRELFLLSPVHIFRAHHHCQKNTEFFEFSIFVSLQKYYKHWRKGWFLHPFCHLMIKTVRVDSHPLPDRLPKALIAYRLHSKMAKSVLAAKLGVSLGTLQNWEFGRTHSNRKSWPAIHALFRT
jgi:DNA-binding XRE family transcriptional regulator